MSAILFSLPLLGIIYEDFKFRAIHWYWLVLILMIGFWHFDFHLEQSLINLSLLLIQFLVLTCYFSFKEKKWINITDKYLGLGDLLFFIPLALFFSPVNFLLFFVGSIIGTLMLMLCLKIVTKQILETIPLAGFQSIFLLLWLWIGWSNEYSFRWDSVL